MRFSSTSNLASITSSTVRLMLPTSGASPIAFRGSHNLPGEPIHSVDVCVVVQCDPAIQCGELRCQVLDIRAKSAVFIPKAPNIVDQLDKKTSPRVSRSSLPSPTAPGAIPPVFLKFKWVPNWPRRICRMLNPVDTTVAALHETWRYLHSQHVAFGSSASFLILVEARPLSAKAVVACELGEGSGAGERGNVGFLVFLPLLLLRRLGFWAPATSYATWP